MLIISASLPEDKRLPAVSYSVSNTGNRDRTTHMQFALAASLPTPKHLAADYASTYFTKISNHLTMTLLAAHMSI